jgi:hypothetical protein
VVAHCHLGLGTLQRQQDEIRDAHEHLTAALTLYREMGMHYWRERAEVELASLARRSALGR